jgi:hypothetical protein
MTNYRERRLLLGKNAREAVFASKERDVVI